MERIGQRYPGAVNWQVPFRRSSAWLLTCLAIGISQSCARPDAFHRAQTSTASNSGTQKLPFHPSADHTSDDTDRPAVPLDPKTPDSAPFRASPHHSLPAGTLVTVRLENSLSIAQLHPGDSFKASIAAPITLHGDTLVGVGTPVTGRLENAQVPVDRTGFAPKAALFRLTLDTMTVDGKPLPLQTSSLFARATLKSGASAGGPGAQPISADYRLQKGRQLTFRLTSPVIFSDLNSVAVRQDPDSSK
jgi:hypothetical protein